MSREFFIRKLIKRDEYDREEATAEVDNAIENALIDSADYGDDEMFAEMASYEDALLNYLGLEPDYIMQFIDAIEEYKDLHPDWRDKLLPDED